MNSVEARGLGKLNRRRGVFIMFKTYAREAKETLGWGAVDERKTGSTLGRVNSITLRFVLLRIGTILHKLVRLNRERI